MLQASENSGNTTVAWPSCRSTPSTSVRGCPRWFGSVRGIGARSRSQSADYETAWPPREVPAGFGTSSTCSSFGGRVPAVPPWGSPARSRPSPSGSIQQQGPRRCGSIATLVPAKTLSRASSAPAPMWQALAKSALASPTISMAPSLVPSPIREPRATAVPAIPTGVSTMPGLSSTVVPQGSTLQTAAPTAAPTPTVSAVASSAGSVNAPVILPEPRTAPTLVLPPRGCPVWVVPQVPAQIAKWHPSWPRRQGPPIQWRLVQQPVEWRA